MSVWNRLSGTQWYRLAPCGTVRHRLSGTVWHCVAPSVWHHVAPPVWYRVALLPAWIRCEQIARSSQRGVVECCALFSRVMLGGVASKLAPSHVLWLD